MEVFVSILANLMECLDYAIKATCPFQVLADNLIERLPMNLGKLQSLKVMILDGNQIASLPDECNVLL